LLWCSIWIVLQTLALQLTFGFGWMTSLADATVTNIVIGIVGYDMILVAKYYQPRHITRLAISIGLTAISVFAIHHVVLLVIDATEAYLQFLDQSLFIRGLFVWLMIALVSAMSGLWFFLLEHQETAARTAAAEKLAREAELSRLRQQLQPHFLFNSLNSISALAGTKPEEARKMIQQLSDFFRSTMRKDDHQLVELSEELDNLSLYLEIEKVRFGHRLKTNLACSDRARTMKIPPLLLQPVAENAIKFGLYDTIGDTTIGIHASAEKNDLIITVKNPFDPSSSLRRGTGFGLSGIQRRLYLLYARNDLLVTAQDGSTFITTVRIPQKA
jgi:hypothetical protein